MEKRIGSWITCSMLSTSLDEQAGLLFIKREAIVRLIHACNGGFRRTNIPQSTMHYSSAECNCQMASEATARYILVRSNRDGRRLWVVRAASAVLRNGVASQMIRYASLWSCNLSIIIAPRNSSLRWQHEANAASYVYLLAYMHAHNPFCACSQRYNAARPKSFPFAE